MTPKLLLADDSVTIQRVIELTFADENVQVLAVGDGQQAIERVQADRPDIVLADVGMPERDGYEVAAFIKGNPQLSHIPVLLLTGAFEPIDEARARAVGCDGVLVKPFEPQMVISRVRDLLAGKRTPPAPARPVPVAVPAKGARVDPAAGEPLQATSGSLEDYFDRLDAALASKTLSPQADLPPRRWPKLRWRGCLIRPRLRRRPGPRLSRRSSRFSRRSSIARWTDGIRISLAIPERPLYQAQSPRPFCRRCRLPLRSRRCRHRWRPLRRPRNRSRCLRRRRPPRRWKPGRRPRCTRRLRRCSRPSSSGP